MNYKGKPFPAVTPPPLKFVWTGERAWERLAKPDPPLKYIDEDSWRWFGAQDGFHNGPNQWGATFPKAFCRYPEVIGTIIPTWYAELMLWPLHATLFGIPNLYKAAGDEIEHLRNWAAGAIGLKPASRVALCQAYLAMRWRLVAMELAAELVKSSAETDTAIAIRDAAIATGQPVPNAPPAEIPWYRQPDGFGMPAWIAPAAAAAALLVAQR